MRRYIRYFGLVITSMALASPGPAEAFKVKIKIKIRWPRPPLPLPGPLPIPIPGGTSGPLIPIPGIPSPYTEVVDEAGKVLGKVTGDIVREAGIGLSNVERESRRLGGQLDTNLRKAGGDYERTLRKAGGDVGREAKAAQREVEAAGTAVYRFAIRQAESSVHTVREAEERFREGKVIDAVWGLGVRPAQSTSDNAARATMESAVLAMVASTAASTYGGPGGAAAYAAWLAYYQTGGDTNAALRVGLVAAIRAYGGAASGAANPAAATVSESLKQAAVTGAVNGLAVAAAGGSPGDVQNAMLASAGSVLVQDGYQALSRNATVAEFAKVGKQVYCVKGLAEGKADKSCPSVADYVKDAQGRYAMLDTSGVVHYVDAAKENPATGWLFLTKEEAMQKAAGAAGLDMSALPIKSVEDAVKDFKTGQKQVMSELDKVKGANIVSLLDDRWAVSYEIPRKVDGLKAQVAPTVLLSYTGVSAAEVAKLGAEASTLNQVPTGPREALSCYKDSQVRRAFVTEGKPGTDDSLKCMLQAEVDGTRKGIWYAKNDTNYCSTVLQEQAKAWLAGGFECAGR